MGTKTLAYRRKIKKSVLKLNQIKNQCKSEPSVARIITDAISYVEESIFSIHEGYLESRREARLNSELLHDEIKNHRETQTQLSEVKSLIRRQLEMGKQTDMMVEVYRVEICGFTHMSDAELETQGFRPEVISWYREWNSLKTLLQEASQI